MSDHQARKRQLADMQERISKQPKDLFFNVFANPNNCFCDEPLAVELVLAFDVDFSESCSTILCVFDSTRGSIIFSFSIEFDVTCYPLKL